MLRLSNFLNPLLWALLLSVFLHASLFSVDFEIPRRSASENVSVSPIEINLVSNAPTEAASELPPSEEPVETASVFEPASAIAGVQKPLDPSAYKQPARLPWQSPQSMQSLVAVMAPTELTLFQAPPAMPLSLSSAQLTVSPLEQEMLESKVETWRQALSRADTTDTQHWVEDGRVYQARLLKSMPEDVTGLGSATVEITRTVNGVT